MNVRELTRCALSVAFLSLCAWISIPFSVPFTLQTFGIFFLCGFLGPKEACISLIVYFLLGMVGFPVFSNFRGGASVLFGLTGGYIFGFLISALFLWIVQSWYKKSAFRYFVCCSVALFLCYLSGTAWFMFVSNGTSFVSALMICVVPFILFDLLKIIMAIVLLYRFHIFCKKM